MSKHLIFLTVPGLRQQDLAEMPNLSKAFNLDDTRRILHRFPAVTWPSQAAVLTGKSPTEHGVTANGFFWREKNEVEMWTAWNKVIQSPQLWDSIRDINPELTSLAWFPMLSKGCSADYVCMPAPIHQPDGSEDLWCYTKPQEYYGELLESLGHFPLQHFWGPMANIKATQWIIDSVTLAAARFRPNFLYVYLPHLDYAAQKDGPDSPAAQAAVKALDQSIGDMIDQLGATFQNDNLCWMMASEYTITAVDHVTFPNRVLREAGLLVTRNTDKGELIDFEQSQAWALVDHQFSQVFVRDASPDVVQQVVNLFSGREGFGQVLAGDQRIDLGMDHERAGEVVMLSARNSWQAYYWWLDDDQAPSFARTVDIHQKPGYDPVELHFDMASKSIPLDATLIQGSHGLPSIDDDQKGVFLSSGPVPTKSEIPDTDLYSFVLEQFSDEA